MSPEFKLIPLLFGLGIGLLAAPVQAQSTPQACYEYLRAATEAQNHNHLQLELNRYANAGCDRKPKSETMSRVSVESLLFLHYMQSRKRAALEVQTARPSWPINGGSSGGGAGMGAAATINPAGAFGSAKPPAAAAHIKE